MPYWEGSVRVNGTYNDLPIKGKGYVELVGYSKKYPIIYMQKEDKIFCYSLSIRNTQLF